MITWDEILIPQLKISFTPVVILDVSVWSFVECLQIPELQDPALTTRDAMWLREV